MQAFLALFINSCRSTSFSCPLPPTLQSNTGLIFLLILIWFRIGGRCKEPELEPCNINKIENRNKSKECAATFRDIMETKDLIEEMCSELKIAVQEYGADLGLKCEDIVQVLEERQLVQMILLGDANSAKLLENIEKAIFESQGGRLHDICTGRHYL